MGVCDSGQCETTSFGRQLTVSVAICAFSLQRWPALGRAMESVLRQSRSPDEIILVIDHNATLLEKCQAQWPECRVLASVGSPGLSGARNTALDNGRGDLIAFLDDDAVAEPEWLASLEACYADDRVVAAGGVVIPAWATARPRWFPAEFDWVVGCSHSGMPTTRAAVRNLIGANMSFRRSDLWRSGGFRDGLGRIGALPMGCEETEACIRVQREKPGVQVIYEPLAAVHHSVPTDRMSVSYFVSRCEAEGRSKAMVASFVGSQLGLSSERSYTSRVLPAAVGRYLRQGAAGEVAGLLKAAAVVVGLLVTTAGYVRGRIAGLRMARV